MPDPTPDAVRARLAAALRDLTAVAGALPDLIGEHLDALAAALADARAEADRLRAQVDRLRAEAERADKRHALEMEQAADESQQAAADAERDVRAARAEAARLRAGLDALRSGRPAAPSTGSTPPPDPSASPTPSEAAPVWHGQADLAASGPPAQPDGPGARLGETFRAWCRAATPVMGKVEFFAGHLREQVPAATVFAVFRDVQSQAVPVRLERTSGHIPVEYWLVALDGRHWLLPQPITAAQFRELSPCFEGHATPTALAAIVPAEVRVVGDRFEIPQPGRVA